MDRMTRRDVLKMAAAFGLAGVVGGPLAKTARASANYSNVVLAKGPVGYWRLGEDVGPTAFDLSGFGYDGTYMGTPDFGQPGPIIGDPSARAIKCKGPGSKDYVEIPDPDPVPPGDGSNAVFSQPTSGLGLTVEVWMRPDTLVFPGFEDVRGDIYIHWLGKCVSGSGECEWGFRFYSKDSLTRPNRISAYIWNPEGGEGAGAYFQYPRNDDEPLVEGQWYHIVAVYEPGDADTPGAGVRIYKNGVKKQGPPSSGTLYNNPPRWRIFPAPGSLPVRLGTRDAATSGGNKDGYLTGGLAEVAIYPYALSGDEIMQNYQEAKMP